MGQGLRKTAVSAIQDLTAAGRILGFVRNLLAVLAEALIALRRT